MPQVDDGTGMNLNEECLLQFLKNEGGTASQEAGPDEGSGLTANLKRVFRRNHYVSFPPAILFRRPVPEGAQPSASLTDGLSEGLY